MTVRWTVLSCMMISSHTLDCFTLLTACFFFLTCWGEVHGTNAAQGYLPATQEVDSQQCMSGQHTSWRKTTAQEEQDICASGGAGANRTGVQILPALSKYPIVVNAHAMI